MVKSARVTALVCAIVAIASAAPAAPPDIPDSIAYQGLLVDGGGVPLAGPVDLTIRVYDALLVGTLLYKQSFSAVPLNVGVFNVTLGPTGAATDVPTPPVTTSLVTALAGDLVSIGADRFIEITVDGDPPLPRSQLLSAAYALRADKAGTATSAETAAIALDTTSINGLPSMVVSEMYEHFNFDGGGPANTDPLEGVGDLDGDGIANFVDTDNDGDTLPDAQEVDLGLGVNLITPNLISLGPSTGLANTVFSVHLTGTSFEPGMSVQFGSEFPTPTNVTATGADVQVGPQPPGVVSVGVTRTNGQVAPFPRLFTFAAVSFTANVHLTFDIQGVSSYLISGTDVYTNGATSFPLASEQHLAVAWNAAGRLSTLRCVDSGANCEVRVGQDASGDFLIQPSEEVAIQTVTGTQVQPGKIRHARLAFDPAGKPVASYTRFGSADVTVARDLNSDGDYADAGDIRNVAQILGFDTSGDGDLALDSSGRAALLYFNPSTQKLKLAWDRSGDGDFSDTVGGNSEHFNIVTMSTFQCAGITFDSVGRAALVYATPTATVLRRDLNADGDFADAGENTTLAAVGAVGCDVKGHATTPGLAVTWAATDLQLRVDRNADDDFADTDEQITLAPQASGPFAPIELGRNSSGKSTVATRNTLYQDPLP
jgi:hypothetical protein